MGFKNFRFRLALRTASLAANLCLFFFLLFGTRLPFTTVFTGLLSLAQCALLIRYVDRTNGLWKGFFEAVSTADFTRNYSVPGGKSFESLKSEYAKVMATLRDYKLEREKQRQYIRTVARSIGVGILVFDARGKVDLSNEAVRNQLGGRVPRDSGELESRNRDLFLKIKEMKNGQRELFRIDLEKESLRVIIGVNDFILLREKHRLVTIQDIQRELEETELEAWQKLARVLTHEIMNSITPISSLASTANVILAKLFASGDPSEFSPADARRDALNALNSIEKRSQGLLYFVENYRKFLKIPKPRLLTVRCADILSRARDLLAPVLEEKKIALRLSVVPRELEFRADGDLIEQALVNLIKNSIEALGKTKNPSINISAYAEKNRIVIEIADNGSGIAEEYLDKIFIPFFTTKNEGSGIGLSLCLQIMRSHGGSIAVKSVPGTKTAFYLRF
jgi:two-component system, NtrC family, nitrogen regulation sensor histidine kinase NtrY